jgi:hypothetical protein
MPATDGVRGRDRALELSIPGSGLDSPLEGGFTVLDDGHWHAVRLDRGLIAARRDSPDRLKTSDQKEKQ